MEPTKGLTHPSDRELESFGDPDLDDESQQLLALHLDACPDCQDRLERIEPSLAEYDRCVETVHARLPRPRRSEATLRLRMERLEATMPRRRPKFWRVARAVGMAASIAGILVLWSSRNSTERRAETLLARAASSSGNRARHRLRIKTPVASFLRPALLVTEQTEAREAASVRARFVRANYDWSDPLSAQSYSAWRQTLKHKTSRVSAGSADAPQQVETTTEDSPLRVATLTFDAKLAPVNGLFQFSDREWVEIAALPAADSNPVGDAVTAPVSAPPTTAPSENVPRESLAERELNVRLAIDALHAGASEPIEVTTGSGAILVTTYHLNSEQEKKLQASLERIGGVNLRTVDENQKQPEVHSADRADLILRTSQDVSFEAHVLAELADRFQPAVESTLSDSSKSKLWDLRAGHAREMNLHLANLQKELQGDSQPVPDSPSASPQELTNRAASLERMIILQYASDDSKSPRTVASPQISAELARLRTLALSYSRYIEIQRKQRE
jgi:hypothetical protein